MKVYSTVTVSVGRSVGASVWSVGRVMRGAVVRATTALLAPPPPPPLQNAAGAMDDAWVAEA